MNRKLDAQAVQRRYKISRATLHRWQTKRGLKFERDHLTGRPYFWTEDLEKFIKANYGENFLKR